MDKQFSCEFFLESTLNSESFVYEHTCSCMFFYMLRVHVSVWPILSVGIYLQIPKNYILHALAILLKYLYLVDNDCTMHVYVCMNPWRYKRTQFDASTRDGVKHDVKAPMPFSRFALSRICQYACLCKDTSRPWQPSWHSCILLVCVCMRIFIGHIHKEVQKHMDSHVFTRNIS